MSSERMYYQQPEKQILRDDQLITEVIPDHSGRTEIYGPEFFDSKVEPPLVDAVKKLYELNVPTNSSGANRSDIKRGFAWIEIDYAKLSDENKKVADELEKEGLGKRYEQWGNLWGEPDKMMDSFNLKISINEKTTVGDVKEKSLGLANRFVEQPPVGITVKQAWIICGKPDPKLLTKQYFRNKGYFYNEINKLFYRGDDKLKQSMKWSENK